MIRNNTERMARDRQRAVRQAARRIMTESATLRDAASSLLQVLCEGLRWDLAFLWIVDHKTGGLERVAIGRPTAAKAFGQPRLVRDHMLPPGAGWPGRVLSGRQPVWIADLAREKVD